MSIKHKESLKSAISQGEVGRGNFIVTHFICKQNHQPPHSKFFGIMFYFYVLQSTKDKNLYFGYTENIEKRLKEHNSGKVASTQNRGLLELVYFEAYRSEEDARGREKQIKLRAQAFTSLKRRIKNSIH